MKYVFFAALLGLATAAHAQTVPLDASQPIRGGAQNQTNVPPLNPGLNQSTIQGPSQVQRTTSSYDAQPSRLPVGTAPIGGTPEQSPTARPDVREQPLTPQHRRRQSTDIAPDRSSNSSNANQPRQVHPSGTSPNSGY